MTARSCSAPANGLSSFLVVAARRARRRWCGGQNHCHAGQRGHRAQHAVHRARVSAHPGYAAQVASNGSARGDRSPGGRSSFFVWDGTSRARTIRGKKWSSSLTVSTLGRSFRALMGVRWPRSRPPEPVLPADGSGDRAGPVGHLAAQMFRASGYRVSASGIPDKNRRQWLADKGFSDVHEQAPENPEPRWSSNARATSMRRSMRADRGAPAARWSWSACLGRSKPSCRLHAVFHEVFHRYVTCAVVGSGSCRFS